MSASRNTLAPIVFSTALLLGACGGDSGAGPSQPPPEPPLVNTPDGVIEQLRVSWEGRNANMGDLFSDTFTFYFPGFDVDFWGLPATWSSAEELACAQKIFAGKNGQRPGGTLQPAIDTRFSFGTALTPVESAWAVTDRQDAPFAGLLSRRYDVIMFVTYESSDFDLVGSRSEFFLSTETFTQTDGTEARRYVLQEWRDLGNPNPALRHGTISWGFFKWMYESVP